MTIFSIYRFVATKHLFNKMSMIVLMTIDQQRSQDVNIQRSTDVKMRLMVIGS